MVSAVFKYPADVPNSYSFSLIIFKNAAKSSCCGTQCRVQTVNIFLLRVSLRFSTKPDLQRPGLVVRAIGARNKFLVFSLKWKPGFQIILLRGSVV